MSDSKHAAIALKICLESLAVEAAKADLPDLATVIALAAHAAEKVAQGENPMPAMLSGLTSNASGHC